MYGWLAVVVFALTSCDSENVTPINDKTLPEAIAKDFHERYEDYSFLVFNTNFAPKDLMSEATD